ncbi:hypothetical protein E4U19_001154 [Claviceps sp. Clav32 group G5]|nr:hypothetical protein E4U19_001154 [Claviceps sp. Clav32 group G5]
MPRPTLAGSIPALKLSGHDTAHAAPALTNALEYDSIPKMQPSILMTATQTDLNDRVICLLNQYLEDDEISDNALHRRVCQDFQHGMIRTSGIKNAQLDPIDPENIGQQLDDFGNSVHTKTEGFNGAKTRLPKRIRRKMNILALKLIDKNPDKSLKENFNRLVTELETLFYELYHPTLIGVMLLARLCQAVGGISEYEQALYTSSLTVFMYQFIKSRAKFLKVWPKLEPGFELRLLEEPTEPEVPSLLGHEAFAGTDEPTDLQHLTANGLKTYDREMARYKSVGNVRYRDKVKERKKYVTNQSTLIFGYVFLCINSYFPFFDIIAHLTFPTKSLLEDFKIKQHRYEKKATGPDTLTQLIQSTVATHLQDSCCNLDESLQKWIYNLKRAVGIDDSVELETSRQRYEAALKPMRSPNQWATWLTE